eukprot:1160897-Pelagomonas_calceolata.AAC.1
MAWKAGSMLRARRHCSAPATCMHEKSPEGMTMSDRGRCCALGGLAALRVPRSATSSPVDVKAIESRLAQERPPHSNAASRRTPPAPPRVCARPRAGSSNCAGMQQ